MNVASKTHCAPLRIEVVVRVDLPAALTEALAQYLVSVRPPVRSSALAASEPTKRGRCRPRKSPAPLRQAQSELATSAEAVTIDDLWEAFGTLVRRPGGELRTAGVMSQFGLPSIHHAKPGAYADLFAALKSALTQI